jgi:hypothetical protein
MNTQPTISLNPVSTMSEATNKIRKTWHERRAIPPHVRAFINWINTIFKSTRKTKLIF